MASQTGTVPSDAQLPEFGINEWLVDEYRQRYLHDPDSVDLVWRDYFRSSPSPQPSPADVTVREPAVGAPGGRQDAGSAAKAVRVAALIHAHRVRGHLAAATRTWSRRDTASTPRTPAGCSPSTASRAARR